MGVATSMALACPGSYKCKAPTRSVLYLATERGDVEAVAKILDAAPEASWHLTLLRSNVVHVAAKMGHLPILEHTTAFVAERCCDRSSHCGNYYMVPRERGGGDAPRRASLPGSSPQHMVDSPVYEPFAAGGGGGEDGGGGGGPPRPLSTQSSSLEELVRVQRTIAHTLDAVNPRGETPLMVACSNGHAQVVRYLILQGADPWVASRGCGRTALHYAALGRQPAACLPALLDGLPADVAQRSSLRLVDKCSTAGYSPLMYAVVSRDAAAVVALLSHQPDLALCSSRAATADEPTDMKGCYGVTPLDMAARMGLQEIALEIMRYHCETGAGLLQDPRRHLNSWRWHPSMTARKWGHPALADMLRPRILLSQFASDTLRYVGVATLQHLAAHALKARLLATLAAAAAAQQGAAAVVPCPPSPPAAAVRPPASACREIQGACASPRAGRETVDHGCGSSSSSSSTAGSPASNYGLASAPHPGAGLASACASVYASSCGGSPVEGVGCGPILGQPRAPPPSEHVVAEEKEDGEAEEDGATCGLCLDEPCSVEVRGCRHGLCVACARQLSVHMRHQPVPCPFCRRPLDSFVPLLTPAGR